MCCALKTVDTDFPALHQPRFRVAPAAGPQRDDGEVHALVLALGWMERYEDLINSALGQWSREKVEINVTKLKLAATT